MYKLHIPLGYESPNAVIRLGDNAFVPFDPGNTDYQIYLDWLEQGNRPIPPDGSENA